jgi:hypothetical protein
MVELEKGSDGSSSHVGHGEGMKAREGVSWVGNTRLMLPCEWEARQEIRPTGLSARQDGLSGQVSEGIMVSYDGKTNATLECPTESMKGLNDPKELLLTSGIVMLSRAEFRGEIGNRTPVLGENSPTASNGGIGDELVREIRISIG